MKYIKQTYGSSVSMPSSVIYTPDGPRTVPTVQQEAERVAADAIRLWKDGGLADYATTMREAVGMYVDEWSEDAGRAYDPAVAQSVLDADGQTSPQYYAALEQEYSLPHEGEEHWPRLLAAVIDDRAQAIVDQEFRRHEDLEGPMQAAMADVDLDYQDMPAIQLDLLVDDWLDSPWKDTDLASLIDHDELADQSSRDTFHRFFDSLPQGHRQVFRYCQLAELEGLKPDYYYPVKDACFHQDEQSGDLQLVSIGRQEMRWLPVKDWFGETITVDRAGLDDFAWGRDSTARDPWFQYDQGDLLVRPADDSFDEGGWLEGRGEEYEQAVDAYHGRSSVPSAASMTTDSSLLGVPGGVIGLEADPSFTR